MNTVNIKAHAKINLSLDVIGKRDDGYHNLKMVMAKVPLFDLVTVSKAQDITVKTNLSFLSNSQKNIAHKASVSFFDYTGIKGGADIIIEKNIPVSAGLAGGSADGAATLQALNILYEANLSPAELEKIGNEIGKDIPFCLNEGVYLAEGTGEKLTKLPDMPKCFMVLTKPSGINVSTREIFGRLDVNKIDLHPDTNGIIDGLAEQDIDKIARRMYNVLEDVTIKMHPHLNDLKKIFIDSGAAGVVMSGSGPSVFGIFKGEKAADEAYASLRDLDEQTYKFDIFD